MSNTIQPGRIVRLPGDMEMSAADSERTVLRIARDGLRADPPRVRFVGKSEGNQAQGALPWPASD